MKRSSEREEQQGTQSWGARRSGFHSLLLAGLILLRLVLAFGCGWLLAFLFTRLAAPISDTGISALFFVLFPPVLGMAATATVDRQHKHLSLLSIATAWFVLLGICTYLYPLAFREDAAYQAMCVSSGLHCHVGPLAVALLNLFLPYGIVAVLLGAGITSLLIQRHRKKEAIEPP